MNVTISIFEPLYESNQTLTEYTFLPLIREGNIRPEWREFQILIDVYHSEKYLEHDYTGIFSPKFNLKCKISGKQFLEFIQAHPGKDVYFINPFPQIAYWSFNVWMQGEHAHPGLCNVAQNLLDACGIDIKLSDIPRHSPNILAYSNFWVGSRKFWQQYVGGLLVPIAEFLENNPKHPAAISVMSKTIHTNSAPFLPFIIERLFSSYLSANQQWSFGAYKMDGDAVLNYCVNDYEKLLYKNMMPVVQEADLSGRFSPELISQMNMLCALWQNQFHDFFSMRPHPHIGKPIEKI